MLNGRWVSTYHWLHHEELFVLSLATVSYTIPVEGKRLMSTSLFRD